MSQRLKRDAHREEAGVSHMWQEEEPCRARREGHEQNAVPVDCALGTVSCTGGGGWATGSSEAWEGGPCAVRSLSAGEALHWSPDGDGGQP